MNNEIMEADFDNLSPESQEEKALELVRSVSPEQVREKVGERLLKLSIETYESLLLDPDPKIRRETAKDVFEILGTKSKGRESGGHTTNIALFPPEYMAKVASGLKKITSAEVVQIIE